MSLKDVNKAVDMINMIIIFQRDGINRSKQIDNNGSSVFFL